MIDGETATAMQRVFLEESIDCVDFGVVRFKCVYDLSSNECKILCLEAGSMDFKPVSDYACSSILGRTFRLYYYSPQDEYHRGFLKYWLAHDYRVLKSSNELFPS